MVKEGRVKGRKVKGEELWGGNKARVDFQFTIAHGVVLVAIDPVVSE